MCLLPSHATLNRTLGSSDTDPVLLSSYSADNNTLLIAGGEEKLALDLRSRTAIKTGGGIRGSITGEYAFLGSDKVAGINRDDPERSGVYSFPEGKLPKRVAMKFPEVESVSNPGDHLRLLMHDMKGYEVGLGDLGSMKFLSLLKTNALDGWDGTIAAEGLSGSVLLAQLNDNPQTQKEVEVLHLPSSPLADLRAAAMSPDGRYLALSTYSRGAIWDLTTGNQLLLMHGFTDAVSTTDDMLYIDIPKRDHIERHITQVSMKTLAATSMTYKTDDHTHMRYGRLTDWKLDEKKKTWTLEMHDPATGNVMWSRTFPMSTSLTRRASAIET